MIVTIGRRRVDVSRRDCGRRACLDVGALLDTPRSKPRNVCLTRHWHGCPIGSVCPTCRLCDVDGPGARCAAGCETPTVAR